MNSFQKHAGPRKRRPETLPAERRSRATLFPRIISLAAAALLAAALPAGVFAQRSGGERGRAAQPRASESAVSGPRGSLLPAGLDAPMRIHLSGTPDMPIVVATIGDFRADLGENGKFFLRREFVEHFVTEVLDLGGPAHAEPMIALLPQQEANASESTFKVGEVSGRLSVLVTARRVFVMCSFAEEEMDTRNLARFGPTRAADPVV